MSVVTTVTPMKRGLKDRNNHHANHVRIRYNRYPDEKGTESSLFQSITSVEVGSYNRYPDEKGTES